MEGLAGEGASAEVGVARDDIEVEEIPLDGPAGDDIEVDEIALDGPAADDAAAVGSAA